MADRGGDQTHEPRDPVSGAINEEPQRSAEGVEPRQGPQEEPRQQPGEDPLRGSRTSGIWAGVVAMAVLLVLLIVFIAQNTQLVEVSFFGWQGQSPLAVTLLIAATAGLFLAAIAASLRMWQVRRRVRRDQRQARTAH